MNRQDMAMEMMVEDQQAIQDIYTHMDEKVLKKLAQSSDEN